MRRFTAIVILALVGIVQAPEGRGDRIQELVREADDLAYFEAFAPARAKLETALRLAERRADRGLTALCLDHLGSVLDFEGDAAAATQNHQRALALAGDIGDRKLAASILASIGLAHWRRSDSAALVALHGALADQEDLDDDAGRARTLEFLGRVHFKKADYAEAKESYRRVVAIVEDTGDRRLRSITFEDLGDLALEQGFFVDVRRLRPGACGSP